MTKKKEDNSVSFSDKKVVLFSILTGAISGFINGVFGGGGGMIVVPMLVHLLKRAPQKAHATAILIILPLSVVSSILYFTFGKFSLSTGIPTGIGVIIGGVLGALLLSKMSSKTLTIIFSVVMAVAGGKMLFF
ncbi:MAG: sulfite exporter TauE/SafE family protein [Clostridiales bacterium]|nr:sulfite exporter TauE/SafE family protein [Clostridiales bacterium]